MHLTKMLLRIYVLGGTTVFSLVGCNAHSGRLPRVMAQQPVPVQSISDVKEIERSQASSERQEVYLLDLSTFRRKLAASPRGERGSEP